MPTVYMVIIEDSLGNKRWLCSGRGNTPFATFNDSRAKAEVTKLRGSGYTAVVIPINIDKFISR